MTDYAQKMYNIRMNAKWTDFIKKASEPNAVSPKQPKGWEQLPNEDWSSYVDRAWGKTRGLPSFHTNYNPYVIMRDYKFPGYDEDGYVNPDRANDETTVVHSTGWYPPKNKEHIDRMYNRLRAARKSIESKLTPDQIKEIEGLKGYGTGRIWEYFQPDEFFPGFSGSMIRRPTNYHRWLSRTTKEISDAYDDAIKNKMFARAAALRTIRDGLPGPLYNQLPERHANEPLLTPDEVDVAHRKYPGLTENPAFWRMKASIVNDAKRNGLIRFGHPEGDKLVPDISKETLIRKYQEDRLAEILWNRILDQEEKRYKDVYGDRDLQEAGRILYEAGIPVRTETVEDPFIGDGVTGLKFIPPEGMKYPEDAREMVERLREGSAGEDMMSDADRTPTPGDPGADGGRTYDPRKEFLDAYRTTRVMSDIAQARMPGVRTSDLRFVPLDTRGTMFDSGESAEDRASQMDRINGLVDRGLIPGSISDSNSASWPLYTSTKYKNGRPNATFASVRDVSGGEPEVFPGKVVSDGKPDSDIHEKKHVVTPTKVTRSTYKFDSTPEIDRGPGNPDAVSYHLTNAAEAGAALGNLKAQVARKSLEDGSKEPFVMRSIGDFDKMLEERFPVLMSMPELPSGAIERSAVADRLGIKTPVEPTRPGPGTYRTANRAEEKLLDADELSWRKFIDDPDYAIQRLLDSNRPISQRVYRPVFPNSQPGSYTPASEGDLKLWKDKRFRDAFRSGICTGPEWEQWSKQMSTRMKFAFLANRARGRAQNAIREYDRAMDAYRKDKKDYDDQTGRLIKGYYGANSELPAIIENAIREKLNPSSDAVSILKDYLMLRNMNPDLLRKGLEESGKYTPEQIERRMKSFGTPEQRKKLYEELRRTIDKLLPQVGRVSGRPVGYSAA